MERMCVCVCVMCVCVGGVCVSVSVCVCVCVCDVCVWVGGCVSVSVCVGVSVSLSPPSLWVCISECGLMRNAPDSESPTPTADRDLERFLPPPAHDLAPALEKSHQVASKPPNLPVSASPSLYA